MGLNQTTGQLTLLVRDEIVYTWFAGVLLWCIIWGFVTKAIVKGKGYENSGVWFWCGFFLGIIGVIVAACKPAVNVQPTYIVTNSTKEYNKSDSTDSHSSTGYWVCKCGTVNLKSLNVCKNCGNHNPYQTISEKKPNLTDSIENTKSIKLQLNELKELLEQDLITEADYDAKKKQILKL